MPDKLNVSKRIKAIISEIKTDVLADVACDHAYISIEAVTSSKARYSIACDINAHSLEKARKNIYISGLCEKIEVRQADGLTGLNASEADTVVIAGIGGRLCSRILDLDTNKTKSFKKFIIQPQSEIELLRRYLHKLNLRITDENIILDQDIFYTIITAEHGSDDPYSELEYIFGKIPILRKHPVLKEYIDFEITRINKIEKSLPENKIIPDLNKKNKMLREALKCLQ